MASTTNPDFNDQTEALEVARAFPEQIRGKTILVTGVNISGIGYATAEAFASQAPKRIIVAGRSTAKLQESIKSLTASYPDVDYRLLVLDLSSQRAVRTAAAEVMDWSDVPTIDILVNSAGIMNLPSRTLNADGIEMQFATNHIGHFLFTNLILPKLIKSSSQQQKAGSTRIINVTSLSPVWTNGIRWSDINQEKINHTLPKSEQPPYDIHKQWGARDPENATYLPLEGYNQSKVANLLFSVALSHKLYSTYGILSFAVHPGVIGTELTRNFNEETNQALGEMMEKRAFTVRSLGAGAATSLVAAVDPGLGMPGRKDEQESYGVYLADCQISDAAKKENQSGSNAERLWGVSEVMVGERFGW